MSKRFDSVLAGASLSARERRVVERIVSGLREQVGADLLAVWLYGSRARGEADPTETDPDRRSDIDLIAVVDPSRDARRVGWELLPLIDEAAVAEDDSPVYYSVLVYDAERVCDRRQIGSFFFQEVDRDKLVLHEGERAPGAVEALSP